MTDAQFEPATQGARAALEVLASTDLDACDRVALDGALAQWRAVRSFTDVFEVRIARRARELADEGRSEPPEGVLRERGRRSTRDAKAAADREHVCEEMPIFEAALSDGDVSTGHLDAVASATSRLDDGARAAFHHAATNLASKAAEESVEDFARRCRELARRVQHDEGVGEFDAQRRGCRLRRRIDRETGLYHFHLELDPVAGSKVSSAYTAHLASVRARHRDDDVSRDWLAATAMVELITGARAVDRRVPEISVLIDIDTFLHGLHAHSVCETEDGVPIPPSTVQRLACDAEVVRAVLNAKGELLDLGRTQRTANRAQRRALKAMYRTCASGLSGAVRGLSDASHDLVGAIGSDEPRQSDPAVQPTPPSRARGWMDTHARAGPHPHAVPPRRDAVVPRFHRRPCPDRRVSDDNDTTTATTNRRLTRAAHHATTAPSKGDPRRRCVAPAMTRRTCLRTTSRHVRPRSGARRYRPTDE